jgi:hypothetical protein
MADFDFDTFLDDVQTYSDRVKSEADDAAERLEALSTVPFTTKVGYAERIAIETDKVSPVFDVDNLPVLEKAVFNWDDAFYDAERFQMPELTSEWFDNLAVILNKEIVEGDPNAIEIYDRLYSLLNSDDSWLSVDLRQAINTSTKSLVVKLTNDIENGGTGISKEVQDAIFNEMYERDNQTTLDSLTKADRATARLGFPLMSDMTMTARDTVLARQEDLQNQRSRQITVLIAERAQQNVQFSENALIQLAGLDQQTFFQTMNSFVQIGDQTRQRLFQAIAAGNDMEQTKVDYALGYARVFSDLTNALLDKYRYEQAARIAEFDGQMKAILTQADIAKTNGLLQQADNELLTKQWQVDMQATTDRTISLMRQSEDATKIRLSAAQSLANFHSSLVEASLTQINAIVSSTTQEE